MLEGARAVRGRRSETLAASVAITRRDSPAGAGGPYSEDGRLTLLSFVWPDQIERFQNLARAIEIARTVPAAVECADAAVWLESQLATPRLGVATVVFHSIVMLYLDAATRERITSL